MFGKLKARWKSAELMVKANDAHNKGNYQLAVDLLEEMFLVDPTRTEALNNLGNAYEKLGRFEDAERAHLKSITTRPNDHLPLVNLAVVYMDMERYKDALDCLQKAYVLRPDFLPILTKIGQVHSMIGDHPSAISRLSEAVRRAPQEHAIWMILADAYDQAGDSTSAQRARNHQL